MSVRAGCCCSELWQRLHPPQLLIWVANKVKKEFTHPHRSLCAPQIQQSTHTSRWELATPPQRCSTSWACLSPLRDPHTGPWPPPEMTSQPPSPRRWTAPGYGWRPRTACSTPARRWGRCRHRCLERPSRSLVCSGGQRPVPTEERRGVWRLHQTLFKASSPKSVPDEGNKNENKI